MKEASEERPLCQRAERSNAVICAGKGYYLPPYLTRTLP
jgi:hypothetical protein